MPRHRGDALCVDVAKSSVIVTIVCYVDLRAIREVWSERMDDWWAEILAKVDDRGYGQVFEVLGTENDDLSLGNEKGELVFRLTCKFAKLDVGDNRTCRRRQVLDVGAQAKIRKIWISVFGMFVMLEGFEGGNFLLWSPAWNVVGILGHWVSGIKPYLCTTQTLMAEGCRLSSCAAMLPWGIW